MSSTEVPVGGADATVTDIETALAILNGGENTEFFSVVNGVITVE